MPVSDSVIIKGVREGLLFLLDDDVPFADLLAEIQRRISATPNFFKGSPVTINAGRRIIEAPEFHFLYRMLTRNEMKVQSVVSMSAQTRMVVEGYGVASRPPSFAAGDAGVSTGLRDRGSSATAPLETAPEGNISDSAAGLFLRCNLRPGQSVRYAGDVCVLGDVDAGAEIVADGDVIVWGSLRGLVHAGVRGDDEAIVCALQLMPTQLSIAAATSRFPSDHAPAPGTPTPEIARLEWGRIVVEAWQAGREP